jgi:hypothetical protein
VSAVLRNTAYLVISSPAIGDGDGVFELRHDLEIESQLEKSYLVGSFGTAIQEAFRSVPGDPADQAFGETVPERRQGYSVDAGGGTWGGSLTFTTGLEGATWGDGSGGTGEANVTTTDASGEGVHPLTRLQVLQYWLANTLSDSSGQVRLHIGHYSNGTYQDYRDGERVDVPAGVYGYPIPINIMACEPRSPQDEPSNITATLQYRRTQVIDGVIDDVADWIAEGGEDVTEFIDNNLTDTEASVAGGGTVW